MSKQQKKEADLEELWNLEEEELERILAEDEKLIELEEEVKKVDPLLIEEMKKQETLFPTLYQPKPPPRPKRKRRTRQIQMEFEPARRWGVKKPARQPQRSGRPVR